MNSKKMKPVIRQLFGVKTVSLGSSRLKWSFLPGKVTIDYSQLAKEFNGVGREHNVVLDSSFFGRHQIDYCFWKALLQKKIFFTRHIWKELLPWFQKPFRNEQIADQIWNASLTHDPAIVLDQTLPWQPDSYAGRSYYTSLLSIRKQRARQLVANFQQQHDRLPTEDETRRILQIAGTERDLVLLKKGLTDIDKPNFFADEDLVACAAAIGLMTGRPTTILTRDGDLLEQFHKLTSLLTAHYQALLFAERYAQNPGGFKTTPMPTSTALEHFFCGKDDFLVKKTIDNLEGFVDWLLPQEFQGVPLTCALLGGDPPQMTLSVITFAAEQDMLRLIQTKGATRGRSTDQLGDKNCHVTGFPDGIDHPRSVVVMATDQCEHLRGTDFNVPRLDIVHATEHREILTIPPPSGA